MLATQVSYFDLKERERHNRASEQETHRTNVAGEEIKQQQNIETQRSNLAREAENLRSNLAKEQENTRSNVARETETHRSNLVTENIEYGNMEANQKRAANNTLSTGIDAIDTMVNWVTSAVNLVSKLK